MRCMETTSYLLELVKQSLAAKITKACWLIELGYKRWFWKKNQYRTANWLDLAEIQSENENWSERSDIVYPCDSFLQKVVNHAIFHQSGKR